MGVAGSASSTLLFEEFLLGGVFWCSHARDDLAGHYLGGGCGWPPRVLLCLGVLPSEEKLPLVRRLLGWNGGVATERREGDPTGIGRFEAWWVLRKLVL